MKKILLAFIVIAPISVFGQVTLDSASIIPSIGDTVDYYIMDNPGTLSGPGASGADQVWDFSGLTMADSTDAEFEGPRGGLATDPDNTNLCEQYSGFTGDRIQYKSSNSDLYIMGSRAGLTQISYGRDSLLKFKYPVSYNDSHISNYYFSSGGLANRKRRGSYKVTVDAWGAMFLPYGGLNDILRIKIEESYNDTTGRFRPTNSTYASTTYEFWQKGTKNYILSIKYIDDDGTLDTVVTYRRQDQVVVSPVDTSKEDTTVIVEINEQKKVQLFPNPATDRITVIAKGVSSETTVRIMSITGVVNRVVKYKTGVFDLTDYPDGVYILMIEEENYQPIRFVKRH